MWGRYEGFDAFVVGTGTSLSGFDFSTLNHRRRTFTIGLNDAVKAEGLVLDFSLFCDVNIWTRYRDMDLAKKTCMVCQPRARDHFHRYEDCKFKDQVWHFNHVSDIRSCVDDGNDDLYVARTVATGGIMMAWKLGARRIFLLGVDGYKLASDSVKGGVYYHDGRGKGNETRKEKTISGTNRIVQDRHDWWGKNMADLRSWFDTRGVFQERWRGSNVFNLSPLSTIETWEKVRPRKVVGNAFS